MATEFGIAHDVGSCSSLLQVGSSWFIKSQGVEAHLGQSARHGPGAHSLRTFPDQMTMVEGQLVSVAVVEKIPALHLWGDEAASTKVVKPEKVPNSASSTQGTATNPVVFSDDITEEERESIIDVLSTGTMDDPAWKAHCSAMAD
eukprot:7020972-Prymnesium_polylepis.1